MKRGEIWTIAGGGGFAGKPCPAVVLQDDHFDAIESITVCSFTTEPRDAPLFRLEVEPDASNGLRLPCSLMVDKIAAIPRSKLGTRVGRLGARDVMRLNRAVVLFLGLAGS